MAAEDEIVFKLVPDDAQFIKRLKEIRQSAAANRVDLNVGLNKEKASMEYRRLQNEFSKASATIRIKADSGASKGEIQLLRARLAGLKLTAGSIDIKGNASQFKNELKQINAELNQVARNARQLKAGGGMFAGLFGGGGRAMGGGFGGGSLISGLAGGAAANMLGGGRFATGGATFGGAVGAFGGPVGSAVGATVGGIGGAAVGAAGSATIGSVVSGLGGLSELLKYEIILKKLIPDQKESVKLFKEIQKLDLSLATVDLKTIADATVKLAGAEFDPENIPKQVRIILDAASMSTAGSAEGTARIIKALTDIRANQALYGEELNQLSELGLPIKAILSREFGGRSVKDIAKDTQTGKLDINTVIDAIFNGLEKKYSGSLAAQNETLTGQILKVIEQIARAQREFAKPIFDPLIEMLSKLSDAIESGNFKEFGETMQSFSKAVGGVIEQMNDFLDSRSRQGKAKETLDKGIASGSLTAGQARNARAASAGIADIQGSKDGMISNQGAADFLTSTTGSPVDPSKVTKEQRAAITNFLGTAIPEAELQASPPPKTLGGVYVSELSGFISEATGLSMGAGAINGRAGNYADAVGGFASNIAANPNGSPEKIAADANLAAGMWLRKVAGQAVGGARAIGNSALGIAGRLPGMAPDLSGLPGAANGLLEDDAKRKQDRLRSESDGRRFDKAAAELPDAFKKFTADIKDPEVRKLVEGSTLELGQAANGERGFDPRIALKEIADMTQKRGTQQTDMAGLNALVQSNIDESIQREQQKKMLEAQEAVRGFVEKQNTILETIARNTGKETLTVIAPG